MKETQYQVRIDNTVSSPFTVKIRLRHGDALSLILFNVALEKVVRELQRTEGGVRINNTTLRILGFEDDLDVVRETMEDMGNVVRLLETCGKKIGLQINANKTKLLELIKSGEAI